MHRYVNGNCAVTLHSDGTKLREFDGVAAAVFPESVDLKITDYCDLGCPYCHEMSTRAGKHGDLVLAANLWADMPAGVEIALGGGNPLAHPYLAQFLEVCKARGHVANITVNQLHLAAHSELLSYLITQQLIHGVGVSVRNSKTLERDLAHVPSPNVVMHLILGVHDWNDLRIANKLGKVLLLGYKTYGWGSEHSDRLLPKALAWRALVPRLFSLPGVFSFDNLAIKQLRLENYFSPQQWKSFYMGDDGQFTMYADVVKREFSVSSTSLLRNSLSGYDSIIECFQKIRSQQ